MRARDKKLKKNINSERRRNKEIDKWEKRKGQRNRVRESDELVREIDN